MKIDKKTFVETIEVIREQLNHDYKCNEAFEVILPSDYVIGYDNGRLYDQIIKLLQYLTDDDSETGWIEYFIWELDFGKKYEKGCCFQNNIEIDLSNAEKLYNVLKNNKK